MGLWCYGHQEQPRTRGEKLTSCFLMLSNRGTTPHTRGKVDVHQPIRSTPRNNPAHAGKSFIFGRLMCGRGNNPAHAGKSHPIAPSPAHAPEQPRTRGEKTLRIRAFSLGIGNNPAHAGKRLADQQVYHTTIEFSFNFVQLTRTRQEPIASSRIRRAWFVPDLPAPRRGMCRGR